MQEDVSSSKQVTESNCDYKRMPNLLDKSPRLVRMSLSSSQYGGCSTRYDTPIES